MEQAIIFQRTRELTDEEFRTIAELIEDMGGNHIEMETEEDNDED